MTQVQKVLQSGAMQSLRIEQATALRPLETPPFLARV